MSSIILSLAALVFLAHFFSAIFVKTRIPEVLPLMLLGIILGPVTGLVKQADFGMVDKVFTSILLIVILFESGLSIKLQNIKSVWAQSSKIIAVSFILTLGAVMLCAKAALGLSWIYAMILGALLADNSFAIIIPLTSKLNISQDTKTTLMMESTVSGVLSIIITITLIQMAKANAFAPDIIAAKILYTFIISIIVGGAAAIFWTEILNKIRKLRNSIFLTIAFVMVVYSFCEGLGSDGSIGAFVFGIVSGNIETIRQISWLKFLDRFTSEGGGNPFNETEKSFFGELVFILTTFFFVYIGISMRLTSSESMLYGLMFTAVIFLIRLPAVNYSLDKHVTRNDCTVASAMVPKGLVAAVLASLTAQSGIPNGARLQDITYSVIMLSIIFATLLAYAAEKGYAKNFGEAFFKRHAENAAEPAKSEIK